MCDTELAWAAGFFDGEGWTSASNGTFWLGVSQKDVRPIHRFVSAVGVGKVYENRLHTVALTGRKALLVLRKLWPYLSAPKREQAQRNFEEVERTRSRRYPGMDAAFYEMRKVMEGVILVEG